MATSQSGIGNDVARHYNSLEEKGVDQRKVSRIYHMRNFNNWIKSMLVNEFVSKVKNNWPKSNNEDRRETFSVLDIGCGKGGDLLKWSKANIDHYVGVDIAETSVEQARNRYEENKSKSRGRTYRAEFYAADCTKTDLEDVYASKRLTFDIVSCQFAFHYSFESVEQADCMLRNITNRLKPGGYFIGTTTDANDIVARVRAGKASNSVYSINFPEPLPDNEPPALFGAKYNFHLDGVVDCPEFLVHFPTFEKLASKHGLTLICRRRFDSYFQTWHETDAGANLLKRMNCMELFRKHDNRPLAGGDPRGKQYKHAEEFLETHPDLNAIGTLSKDEWEAITLYLVFAFKKISSSTPTESTTSARFEPSAATSASESASSTAKASP